MSTRDEEHAALRRSEEQHRLAFEAAQGEFWDWDLAAGTWSCSPGLATMLDYEPDALAPSREALVELVHTADRERLETQLEQHIAAGTEAWELEYRLRAQDGAWRWIRCRGRTVSRDADGRASRIIGVHIDVSGHRRTERALRESEDRYRMLVESQGEGIGIVDQNERFTYANPAGERIFGVPPGGMVGRSVQEFVDPNAFEDVLEQTGRRKGGSRGTYELGLRLDDGRRRTLLVTATPRYDEDGAYLGAFGVFRDLTERKQMEVTLREQEERYRQLIESLPHGVALLQGGATVFANRTALQMLGLESVEQLRGLHPAAMLVEAERERVVAKLSPLLGGAGRGPVQYTTRACRAGGEEFPVEAIATGVTYGGEPAVQLFMMDISDRLRAEKARARLEEQLQQSQRLESIGRLAGGIAHDFNNLLSPILLYAELALEEMKPGVPHFEDFTEIAESVRQAKGLTQQLLAFGRRQVLQMKVLGLNDVVEGAEQLLRRLIREDIDIVFQLDPSLGNVRVDPTQIQQVVMNLALNARDSMSQGGRMTIRTKNVRLDADGRRPHAELAAGRYVTLEVADTGRGMDGDTRAQVFEPFFTTKAIGKGTGLGLATVHGIVKQHGGTVEVRSKIDEGSSFTVFLPRVDDATRISSRPGAGSGERTLRGTVLLAEDDERVREQVERILRRFGAEVIVAKDGKEALRKAVQHVGSIQVLLTDVVMPRMNGRELFEQLRHTRPEVGVVYMSGYTDDIMAEQGVIGEEGLFLQKPFSLDTLLAAVGEALGR